MLAYTWSHLALLFTVDEVEWVLEQALSEPNNITHLEGKCWIYEG